MATRTKQIAVRDLQQGDMFVLRRNFQPKPRGIRYVVQTIVPNIHGPVYMCHEVDNDKQGMFLIDYDEIVDHVGTPGEYLVILLSKNKAK